MKINPEAKTDIRTRAQLREGDVAERPVYERIAEPGRIAMMLAGSSKLPSLSLGQLGAAAEQLAARHWPGDVSSPRCDGPRRIASALALLRDATRLGNQPTFAAYADYADAAWFPSLVLCADGSHQAVCTILATDDVDLVSRYAPAYFVPGMTDRQLGELGDALFTDRQRLAVAALVHRPAEVGDTTTYDHLVVEFTARQLSERVRQLYAHQHGQAAA